MGGLKDLCYPHHLYLSEGFKAKLHKYQRKKFYLVPSLLISLRLLMSKVETVIVRHCLWMSCKGWPSNPSLPAQAHAAFPLTNRS